jgi:hypothetical protein
MTNIETFTIADGKEFVLIRHNYDDGFTTMLKSTYDEQQAQAEHFTPSV